jgi:DNA-binding transcriptional LysR family regulator
LRDFHKLFPDSQCYFEQKEEPFILTDLLDGKLDVIITSGRLPKNAHLCVKTLLTDPFFFICHKNHPLAKKKEITATDIANERFLVSKSHMTSPQEAEHELWKRMGKIPQIVYSLDEWMGMLLYVQVNLGVAIISSFFKYMKLQEVVFIPFSPDLITRNIYLVWDERKTKTTIAKEFIEHVNQYPFENLS